MGLSLGSAWKARLPGKVLPAIWIGFVILCAHLIDLVEWILILINPTRFSSHELTNSPALVGLVFIALVLLLAVVWRVRTLTPYLIVAAALASHLVLDHLGVRRWLSNLYATGEFDELLPLEISIEAEIWFYGVTVVLVLLVRAALDRTCPRAGRKVAIGLAVVATVAMLTRRPIIWAPCYAIGTLHALLLLRRELHPTMLWGIVPLLPLFVLVAAELWASRVEREALAHEQRGAYAAAARLHQRALAAPKRSSRTSIYIHLSNCQRELDDWQGAERSLRLAVATAESRHWPLLSLARLLSHPKARGTEHYRPEEAIAILRQIAADPDARKYHPGARKELSRLGG